MFLDRQDGGEQLGRALQAYRDRPGAIILAIPKGGVETGYHVARALHLPLSVIVARKLGHPLNPELAIGALAESDGRYLDSKAVAGLTFAALRKVIEREKQAITQRIAQFRGGAPLPSLRNKTVILVDDGMATGATMLAAIATCKKQRPARLVVAAPVASASIRHKLEDMVDEVVVLEVPSDYYAVSQVYQQFTDFPVTQVQACLEKWAEQLPLTAAQP